MPTTISQLIPKLWSAMLMREFQRMSVFGGITTDKSGETPIGNKISLGRLTNDVAINDYSHNTDINDPETLTSGADEIVLDQQKYFHIYVDDIDRVQSNVPLLSAYTQKAAHRMADTFDGYVYGILNGSAVDATHKQTIADLGDAMTADQVKAMVRQFASVNKAMTDLNVPREDRWCVIGTPVEYALLQYLREESGGDWGSGDMGDAAWRNNMLSDFLGMSVMCSTQLPTAFPTGSGTAKKTRALIGRRESIAWSIQIQSIQSYMPEKRFGTAVKGLWTYGGVAWQRLPASVSNPANTGNNLIYKLETAN